MCICSFYLTHEYYMNALSEYYNLVSFLFWNSYNWNYTLCTSFILASLLNVYRVFIGVSLVGVECLLGWLKPLHGSNWYSDTGWLQVPGTPNQVFTTDHRVSSNYMVWPQTSRRQDSCRQEEVNGVRKMWNLPTHWESSKLKNKRFG